MDEAIPHVYPRAWGIAYAEDGVGLQEDRTVLAPCQHLLQTWLTGMGRTLHEAKRHMSHTLDGDQPGCEFLGVHIRPYRVGNQHAGKHPYGHRLGVKTLLKPATANIQEHLAESGRSMQRAKALPQSEVSRQLNPPIRGWANDDRICVSPAVDSRRAQLTWAKLRRWAPRRHPTTAAGWVQQRYGPRVDNRLTCATSATDPAAVHLLTHSEVAMRRHSNISGNRSP
jgi:RNA-directed DNA polymerase